jgi:superfamily II DNA or RNA helicase
MKVALGEDYQVQALDALRDTFRAGHRKILVIAPTGAGKTVIAAALMELVVQKGKRANFLVDRLSLVDQTSVLFDRYELQHGVIQSQHPRFRPSEPVQICSIQTIAKRGWPESHIDVFDEAHVLHAAHKARMQSGSSLVVGMTATPFTKGLGKYFTAVVNVTTTRRLIEQGWLVPYRAFSCAEPDMSGVTVSRTGEWDSSAASKKALTVVGDVVGEYLKHGEDRKFICSAVDTAHVEELQRQFLAAGINVASYTYRDEQEDRAETTAEFRRADSAIRGIITVTAASRGFDIPDLGCVIMARPLRKSLAEHIQLLGRGLRISPETGKKDCLILDHAGNMARFWQDTEDFFDNGLDQLDDGNPKKKKAAAKREPEPVKCPTCRAVHKPAPFCPSCGHQYPARRTVQHEAGSLKELIASGDRKRLTVDLWPQIVAYCLAQSTGEMARKRALAIFKEMTGTWPRVDWDETVAVLPSPEVISRILAQQIRFSHRKKDVPA